MRTRTTTSGTSGYKQIHSDIHQTVYSRSSRKVMGETLVTNKIVLLRLLLWGRDHAPKELIGLTSPLWIEDKASTSILDPNLNLHQLWLHLRIENHLSLKLNLLKYLSHFLPLWTNLIGIDLHRKEKGMKILKMEKINWSLYPLLDLWKKIGRFQSKKPWLILLEPKLPVKSRRPTPSNWSAMSARDNMTALSGFWAPGIPPHLKKLLATWRQSLLTLVRWQKLRLRDPTPLKSQMLWAMDCSSLRTSGTRNHSRTMTPMCTTSFMALQIKEHLLSLLRNWFDLGTSPSAGTWQTVDSYGFYSAGEVAAKTVQFSSSIKELTRKILKIGKGTLPVFIGGIYTGRNQHINQMSGGNEEVQRLCGEHGDARGKEKYLVARSEHTTVHGVVITYKNAIRPRALENSPPCSIFRGTHYSLWIYQRSSTRMTMGLQPWQL